MLYFLSFAVDNLLEKVHITTSNLEENGHCPHLFDRELKKMTDAELLREIEAQRALMIAVATGGPQVETVNHQYTERRVSIIEELNRRGFSDPNPYSDLWQWYGKWSSGDLPTYASRRIYISELYQPLIDSISARGIQAVQVFEEPTGWARVDRDIGQMRQILEEAQSEVKFQSVGLFCRELLITLAQTVYDRERHPSTNGVNPSPTDAKRMLDAYIAVALGGGTNEIARSHARAALNLANELQHRRTATFREAALCAEATTAVVNFIAIISGRRDPEQMRE